MKYNKSGTNKLLSLFAVWSTTDEAHFKFGVRTGVCWWCLNFCSIISTQTSLSVMSRIQLTTYSVSFVPHFTSLVKYDQKVTCIIWIEEEFLWIKRANPIPHFSWKWIWAHGLLKYLGHFIEIIEHVLVDVLKIKQIDSFRDENPYRGCIVLFNPPYFHPAKKIVPAKGFP